MTIIGSLDRDSNIDELQYGVVSFDNFRGAILLMFQLLTLEGWLKIMNNYRDSSGDFLSVSFFIVVILICTFVCRNLITAVLVRNFSNIHDIKTENTEYKLLCEKVESLDIPTKLKQ